jgi:hypothetical protein
VDSQSFELLPKRIGGGILLNSHKEKLHPDSVRSDLGCLNHIVAISWLERFPHKKNGRNLQVCESKGVAPCCWELEPLAGMKR